MASLRRWPGATLVVASLLLYLFTVFCFAAQPDRLAAFTVMPIWLWGGGGILLSGGAYYFLRARWSLTTTAVWLVTLVIASDEAKVLWHFDKTPPLPGTAQPHQGKPVLRVVTLNCAFFTYGDPIPDVAAWHPDIVLLQEVFPFQASLLANRLFAGQGDSRSRQSNAVVSRWKITQEVPNPPLSAQQLTVKLPNGQDIEIVNVHLPMAATDLRLWRRAAWADHRHNRLARMQDLDSILGTLRQTSRFPNQPTLLGGDFNAPASDIVHRQLAPDFSNAFATAGTGWGNTFQHRLPILRIDHLYVTRQFTPVRCRVVNTHHSDHRMVVADFLLE